jgi:hypothetical protein
VQLVTAPADALTIPVTIATPSARNTDCLQRVLSPFPFTPKIHLFELRSNFFEFPPDKEKGRKQTAPVEPEHEIFASGQFYFSCMVAILPC